MCAMVSVGCHKIRGAPLSSYLIMLTWSAGFDHLYVTVCVEPEHLTLSTEFAFF